VSEAGFVEVYVTVDCARKKPLRANVDVGMTLTGAIADGGDEAVGNRYGSLNSCVIAGWNARADESAGNGGNAHNNLGASQ
jgi:hypothetical protein